MAVSWKQFSALVVIGAFAVLPAEWAFGQQQAVRATPLAVNVIKRSPVQPKLAGKKPIQIVEFWATWCGPCKTTIPHLTKIQEAYAKHGVSVTGISDEDEATVRPFVEQMGDAMRYTVALDKGGRTSAAYQGQFKVSSIPHAYIVDRQGMIRWHGHPMDQNMIRALDILIAEKRPNAPSAGAEDVAPAPPAHSNSSSASELPTSKSKEYIFYAPGDKIDTKGVKIHFVNDPPKDEER